MQALLTWATSAREQPGVLASRVYEDLETAAAFCLVAEWDSREAMERHIRGPGFGVVLGALEVLAALPLVTITSLDDPDGSDAMRSIRRLRGSTRDL